MISLEDNAADIIGKAQRGLGISDSELAKKAGVSAQTIRKLRDGDLIEIVIDRRKLEGTVNFVGENGVSVGAEAGTRMLAARAPRPDLTADAELPDATRLWAALQDASGGTWNGSVFDVDAILRVLAAGKRALAAGSD